MSRLPWADVLARPAASMEAEALGPWDDFPVHQSPALLALVTPAQPGWAERFYFNVLRPTGELVAVIGAGVYPARGVSESYFCRIEGDRQHNVRAFRALPRPGAEAHPGEVSLVVQTPLKDWGVVVDIEDVRFDGSFGGVVDPYLYDVVDVPASEPDGAFDLYRHFVALGRWEVREAPPGLGELDGLLGVRDRTWGVRTRRVRWHNWYVFHLGDSCLTLIHQELSDGSVLFSEAGAMHADGRRERFSIEGHDLTFDRATREVVRGEVKLLGDEGPTTLSFERVGVGMRLAGAGYDDKQGDRDGDRTLQRDGYDLGDPEVAARTGRGTIDGGARGQVSGSWEAEGIGVVESAIARDHVGFGEQVR